MNNTWDLLRTCLLVECTSLGADCWGGTCCCWAGCASFASPGVADWGLVQSGSDRESFREASVLDAAPWRSSRVSRWFKLLERTCKRSRKRFENHRQPAFWSRKLLSSSPRNFRAKLLDNPANSRSDMCCVNSLPLPGRTVSIFADK